MAPHPGSWSTPIGFFSFLKLAGVSWLTQVLRKTGLRNVNRYSALSRLEMSQRKSNFLIPIVFIQSWCSVFVNLFDIINAVQTSFIHRVEPYGSRLAPSSPWDRDTHGPCSGGAVRRPTFGIFTNYHRIFQERNSGGLIPIRRESVPHEIFTFHSSLIFVLYIGILRRVDSKMFLAVDVFLFPKKKYWICGFENDFCGGRSLFSHWKYVLRDHVTRGFKNDFCGVQSSWDFYLKKKTCIIWVGHVNMSVEKALKKGIWLFLLNSLDL